MTQVAAALLGHTQHVVWPGGRHASSLHSVGGAPEAKVVMRRVLQLMLSMCEGAMMRMIVGTPYCALNLQCPTADLVYQHPQ